MTINRLNRYQGVTKRLLKQRKGQLEKPYERNVEVCNGGETQGGAGGSGGALGTGATVSAQGGAGWGVQGWGTQRGVCDCQVLGESGVSFRRTVNIVEMFMK